MHINNVYTVLSVRCAHVTRTESDPVWLPTPFLKPRYARGTCYRLQSSAIGLPHGIQQTRPSEWAVLSALHKAERKADALYLAGHANSFHFVEI